MKGKIVIDAEFCKECHLCIEHCNKKCIAEGDEYNVRGYRAVKYVDDGTCNGCTLCAIVCPEVAIEVFRE